MAFLSADFGRLDDGGREWRLPIPIRAKQGRQLGITLRQAPAGRTKLPGILLTKVPAFHIHWGYNNRFFPGAVG